MTPLNRRIHPLWPCPALPAAPRFHNSIPPKGNRLEPAPHRSSPNTPTLQHSNTPTLHDSNEEPRTNNQETLIVAFASYLCWFWLLRRYLASRLSIFSFLTPLFGIVFGILILHEPVDPRFILGALLVLSGITLVNRR